MSGQDACPDSWQKAAARVRSIARGRGPVDGNKRLAWYPTGVFPQLNGHPLDPAFGVDEAERFVLDICQGALDGPGTTARLPLFTR